MQMLCFYFLQIFTDIFNIKIGLLVYRILHVHMCLQNYILSSYLSKAEVFLFVIFMMRFILKYIWDHAFRIQSISRAKIDVLIYFKDPLISFQIPQFFFLKWCKQYKWYSHLFIVPSENVSNWSEIHWKISASAYFLRYIV